MSTQAWSSTEHDVIAADHLDMLAGDIPGRFCGQAVEIDG